MLYSFGGKILGIFKIGGNVMKKGIAVLFVLVGLLAVILGFCAFGKDTGYYENSNKYGGDAYTGIQNAAAQTANNVQDLAEATTFGFGSILLVGGIVLVLVGINNLSMADVNNAKKAINTIKQINTNETPSEQTEAEITTEQPEAEQTAEENM